MLGKHIVNRLSLLLNEQALHVVKGAIWHERHALHDGGITREATASTTPTPPTTTTSLTCNVGEVICCSRFIHLVVVGPNELVKVSHFLAHDFHHFFTEPLFVRVGHVNLQSGRGRQV